MLLYQIIDSDSQESSFATGNNSGGCREGKSGSEAGRNSGNLRDVFDPTPVSLSLDSSIEEALRLMRQAKSHCVAVMEAGALAGLVTGEEILRLAPIMLTGGSSEV